MTQFLPSGGCKYRKKADIALIADGQFGAKYFAHKVEAE